MVPTVDESRRIEVPALVLGHRADLIHPFSDADALARQLPRARLEAPESLIELRWRPDPPAGLVAALSDRLARRHAQYRDHPFERILVLDLAAISGWAATS